MRNVSKQLPIVTIVGRQNVGKSTLFNALIREKKAIVDSFPGLTRDIINYSVNFINYNLGAFSCSNNSIFHPIKTMN